MVNNQGIPRSTANMEDSDIPNLDKLVVNSELIADDVDMITSLIDVEAHDRVLNSSE